jgi:hypothetical protein
VAHSLGSCRQPARLPPPPEVHPDGSDASRQA